MSSSSSRPYQSKVFNFFNQYSRQVSQKLETTIRNLKVATKWSVESLLYPLYQLLQPNQLIAKRLQTSNQTTQTSLKSHTPPPADTPIHNVLESVKNLPSAAASEPETLQNLKSSSFFGRTWEKIAHSFDWLQTQTTPKLQPEKTLQYHIPTVQGIAVKLETRNLVLVTENNQVLDVLTISQQRKLNDTINQEIAKYSHKYSHILQLPATQQEDDILPEINRLLNKLTNSSNSSIIYVTENPNTLEIKSYPPTPNKPNKILAVLDSTLAKLEAKAIIPVKQQSQGIIQIVNQIVKTKLEIFIYGKEQVEARGDISVNADRLKQQNLYISAFIESAINYFFGGRKIPQLKEEERFDELPKQTVNKTLNKIIDISQNQKSDLTLDSWLTLSDLFGNLEIIDNTRYDNKQQVLTTEKKRIVETQKTAAKTSEYIFENDREPEKQQNRLKPDWIETNATFIGYEKHPLEQILEWLDYIMLWIEVIFTNMIYFFKGLLQG